MNKRQNLEEEIERIFTDEFREELRNRGRLSFDKVLKENALFLQQDLRLTTTKLNEDIQETLKRVLKEEFAQYSQSIDDARSLAIQSIEKTQTAMEQQRLQLTSELKEYVDKERQVIVARMDEHLTETIHSYIVEVLGDEVDLAAQSSYILRRLEEDKETIREDIVNVIQP